MNHALYRPGIVSLAFCFGLAAAATAGPVSGNANPAGPVRCATFGGVAVPGCENHPDWTTGDWQPTARITTLHVLVVGGGGGGAASIERGIGGTGGASGQVLTALLHTPGRAIAIAVGRGGQAGARFCAPGLDGGFSSFGAILAAGGQGGADHQGGSAPDTVAGSSGGGGGGGGTYQPDGFGGQGGSGGTAGRNGVDGAAAEDRAFPVQGTHGGTGTRFPLLDFLQTRVSAGRGGFGGQPGMGQVGYGGGGGGGGGGILIGRSAAADRGHGSRQAGAGGTGYGAGGGGGGNVEIGSPGGSGAAGVVYVEWSDDIVALALANDASER